jgi:hypothetical protein
MVIFMEREKSRIHKGWDRYASGTQGYTITDFGVMRDRESLFALSASSERHLSGGR